MYKSVLVNIDVDKIAWFDYNNSNRKQVEKGSIMELDKYIKKVLIDKEIKQVELAEKLNISRASLGGLISRNKMGVDKLEEIATALNCDVKITFIDKETGKEY